MSSEEQNNRSNNIDSESPTVPRGRDEEEVPADLADASAASARDPEQDTVGTEDHEDIEQPKAIPPSTSLRNHSGIGWLARTGVNAAATIAVAALILILIGAAQRTGWITSGASSETGEPTASKRSDSDSKRYICPMMCTPPSSEPGRCPVCGMELVEATSGTVGDGKSIEIESSARRLIGIQTAVSEMSHVNRTIRTVGSISFDESRLSTISAYVDGRLEKMYADYVGVRVNEGDDVALIYSPQLYTAQAEFISSMNAKPIGRFDFGDSDLGEVARANLSELGMSGDQIEELRISGEPQSRIRIKSPRNGTVIEKSAVEGDYVKTGQKLYRIADLSTVWLMLDLFPDDAAAVRFGQEVEAEIQSLKGVVFTGRVAFIDPTVDPKTRTVRVRVEVVNFDGKLRPGDYATARIAVPAVPADLVYDPALAGKYISPMHPQIIRDDPGPCPFCGMDLMPTSELGFSSEPLPQQQVVTVPRDSVLLAGNNGVIYVETERGKFEIRRVTVGPMTDTEAVIIEGLAPGETVATGGNFLIDSQMQLAGNPSLLDPSRAPSFSAGPLQLPDIDPAIMSGEAGNQFDLAFKAYFEIQSSLSADTNPPPFLLNKLTDRLAQLEGYGDVPEEAQRQFGRARRAAERMEGGLDRARSSFRTVSRAMLRAAIVARGPQTANSLKHYFCPMVPGNGGDWMQAEGELANPYWGSEMLRCGEVTRDLAVAEEGPTITDAQQSEGP